MKPPVKKMKPVKVDEWLPGEIVDIKYDLEHEFPAFKDREAYTAPAVKIVLLLDGEKEPRPSFWMTFNYKEKSKLYNLYLIGLVEGAQPNMDFDLDNLKGMRIKAMFDQKPGKSYQFLSKIRPLEQKALPPKSEYADVAENEEEVQF